ncbi:hypothetical protein V8F44DRAFT_488287, partial [Aspergillus fumigatus]
VPDDLLVRDEYLDWIPEKPSEELVDYDGVTFDHLVPPDDTKARCYIMLVIETEDGNDVYCCLSKYIWLIF